MFGLTMNTGSSDTIYEKDGVPMEESAYHGAIHYIFNNSSTAAAWMAGNTEYYIWAADGVVDMKVLIRSTYEAE